MNRRFAGPLIVGAALVFSIASARAGPCTSKIAQFEKAVCQSANNPDRRTDGGPINWRPAGPPADARLGEAGRGARASIVRRAMARAKRLDARAIAPGARAL